MRPAEVIDAAAAARTPLAIDREPETRPLTFVCFQNCLQDSPAAKEVRDACSALASDERIRLEHVYPNRHESPEAGALRAADRARALGGALVAVGGDGTINLIAQLAIAHDCPMGIVPRGTFNFVAREHGIPETLDEAVAALLAAPIQPTQIARANERFFLVNASVGLYRRVLAEREWFKRSLGRHRAVAAMAAIVTALRACPMFRFSIDGASVHEQSRAATVLIGNNRLQLQLAGFDDIDTVGQGDLFCARMAATGRWRRLWAIARGAVGSLPTMPEIRAVRIRELRLDLPRRRRRDIGVALDGEIVRLTLPIQICACPDALRLIRPMRASVS
ncbi:MAG: diacylglycerol kinase family protein [Burkholderiaceae bacterium]